VNPSDHERSELDAVDDAALNEYLRRDSAVSQRYRELDAAAVPAALDQAVLAQAKAAVADKKVSRWRGVTRWSAPLALAASVVVVVSIVLQPSMQNELSRTAAPTAVPLPKVIRSEQYDNAAVPEAKKEASREDAVAEKAPVMIMLPDRLSDTPPAVELMLPAPSPAPAQRSAPVPEAASESEEKAKQSIARSQSSPPFAEPRMQPQAIAPVAPPPPAEAPVPNGNRAISSQAIAPAAPAFSETSVTARRRESERASDDLSEVIITGTKRQLRPGAGAGPRGTVVPSSEGVAAANQSADKPFDRDKPDSWLDYIRRLRAQGEASRADTEWSRFRRQYPDFNVDKNDAARPGQR
jgi:hypothetical protein